MRDAFVEFARVCSAPAKPARRRAVKIWRRPAQPGDYALALALYIEGTGKRLERLGNWNEVQTISRFEAGFEPSRAWVICAGDEEIGWMQVTESPERLHLQQLHLLGEFRGRGIGSQLLRQLLEQAGVARKPVVLNVIVGNPAQALYERHGFKVSGTKDELVNMLFEP